MRQKKRQMGMSLLGVLAILAMAGFFALCAIRMIPPYFEFLSVQRIIANAAMEEDTKDMSSRQIRGRLETIFHSNQIYDLKPSEIKVVRKLGVTYLDARYEKRLPIAWRIDAIMRFDDLLYQVGEPVPIAEIPKKK